MHRRMQGLDPAVHHLGEAGQRGHVADGKIGGRDRRARAAGRGQLDAQLHEGAGGFDEPGLVRGGKKGVAHRLGVGARGGLRGQAILRAAE